jgi:hypothetical protein
MVGTSGTHGYGDVDARVAQAHERAARAAAWASEMERITGRGTALGGGVTVDVDLGGVVVGLGISDGAAASGGRSVAEAILTAHAAAQRSVREQAERSAVVAWGAGSATVDAVTAEVDGLNPSGGEGEDPGGGDVPNRGGAW